MIAQCQIPYTLMPEGAQLLILLVAYKIPFYEIINQDGYASEVVSFAGSIGLILTIPYCNGSRFLSEKDKHDYTRYYK